MMNENEAPKNAATHLVPALCVGVALVLFAMVVAVEDLMNANRPHELEMVPAVAAILVANLVAQIRVAFGLRMRLKERAPERLRLADWLLILLVPVYQVFSVLFLLAAGSTLIEQLF